MSVASEITRLQTAKADIKASIEAKGITVSNSLTIDEYPVLIDSIYPDVPPKDINFFDYDGTLLYSYGADEFQSLTSLPPNPTHPGLTAQGWNWTLADIKSVTDSTNRADQRRLNVGQNYITVDGKTHLYIDIPTGHNTLVQLNFETYWGNSTIEIEWGDGNTDTVSGDSDNNITTTHTYSSTGNYVIKVKKTSNQGDIGLGITNKRPIIGQGTNVYDQTTLNLEMCSYLRKVEVGTGFYIRYQAFSNQSNLETITIPATQTTGIQYPFRNCYALKFLVYPSHSNTTRIESIRECYALQGICFSKYVTIIAGNAFYEDRSLKYLSIPKTVTTLTGGQQFYGCRALSGPLDFYTATSSGDIGSTCFENMYSINRLTLPSTVTAFSGETFRYCRVLKEIIVPATTPPTLGHVNAFLDLPSDYVIKVPANSINSYRAAPNWSDSSIVSHIVSM